MPVNICCRLVKVRFKKEQLRQIRAIWEHWAWSNINLAQGKWPGLQDRDNVEGGREDREEINVKDKYEIRKGKDKDVKDIESSMKGDQSGDDNNVSEQRDNYESEDKYKEDEQSVDNNSSAVDELLELVFQLSIMFSTKEFIDSQPSSCLLVYFTGGLAPEFCPRSSS